MCLANIDLSAIKRKARRVSIDDDAVLLTLVFVCSLVGGFAGAALAFWLVP